MDFNPLNEDHAVAAVRFRVLLNRVLSNKDIASVRGQHRRWKDELPAVSTSDGVYVGVNAITRMPEPHHVTTVEFSVLRPDGTPSWILRFSGNEICAECLRYTRWNRVSAMAIDQMFRGLNLIGDTQPNMSIAAISLEVVDQFKTTNLEYQLSSLLKINKFFPNHLFDAGPTWHSHVGWFRDLAGDPILSQLNIDARRESSDDVADVEFPRISVILGHMQEMRLQAPEAYNANKDRTLVENSMQKLHDANKELLCDVLTVDIRNRIGLGV